MRFSAPAVLLAGMLGSAVRPLHAANITAAEFANAVDRLNVIDPQSPETLNARLAYADFLAKLEGADCSTHLKRAQDQLDAAKASPALGVVLPAGLARVADVEYQLHVARAACDGSADMRDHELLAALDSAKRAVDLYRDAFDAVAMVTMQFNTSMAYHNLGREGACIAALQATIDLDREYGFADDAADNYRLLLQWRDEAAGPDQIAARMEDFPQRSATLTFGWREIDATVSVSTDVVQFADGQLAHIRGSRTARQEVRKGRGGWIVSFQPSDGSHDLGNLPTKELLVEETANSLARMLTVFRDFRIAHQGDFNEGLADFKFAAPGAGGCQGIDPRRRLTGSGLSTSIAPHRSCDQSRDVDGRP